MKENNNKMLEKTLQFYEIIQKEEKKEMEIPLPSLSELLPEFESYAKSGMRTNAFDQAILTVYRYMIRHAKENETQISIVLNAWTHVENYLESGQNKDLVALRTLKNTLQNKRENQSKMDTRSVPSLESKSSEKKIPVFILHQAFGGR